MLRIAAILSVFLISMMIQNHEAKAYGALAANKSSSPWSYAMVYNDSSATRARSGALKLCGSGCSTVATFVNKCVATAVGSTGSGWASSSSLGGAKLAALSICKKNSPKGCKFDISGCDGK